MKYDKETEKWFQSHIGYQTTVCICEKCGLFYKPMLGHKCKKIREKVIKIEGLVGGTYGIEC